MSLSVTLLRQVAYSKENAKFPFQWCFVFMMSLDKLMLSLCKAGAVLGLGTSLTWKMSPFFATEIENVTLAG